MNNTKMTRLGFLVACLFASTAGVAADNCSGHYVSVGVSGDSSEQSSRNSLAMFRAVSVNITDDKNSPLNMSVGDCVGTMITAVVQDGCEWALHEKRQGRRSLQLRMGDAGERGERHLEIREWYWKVRKRKMVRLVAANDGRGQGSRWNLGWQL